jgi:MFS family permease
MLKNKLHILFLCQALYWGTVIIGVSLASIVGSQLATNAAYATLPLAILTVGNIVTTLPLSIIMQRKGRRVGFSIGASACIIGGSISCYAIYINDFWLFCFGNMLLGVAQASALYYRLAATDGTSPNKHGRAIAWVMSGGIAAAIFAPSLAIWSKDLFLPHLFVGSYALVGLFGLITLILCLLLPSSPMASSPNKKGRPLSKIIRQPIFIAAISNIAISHATMVLIMISTPLAMLACNYSVSDATHVIQWHVLGMFIPSFFSGKIIDRFGATTVSLIGIVILTISIMISLNGITLTHFYSSLFLLGIGWNLMYTSGSTLLTNSHTAEEKGQVQGLSELITSSLAALAAFGSGALLHSFGWEQVNYGSLPLLFIVAMIVVWFKTRKEAAAVISG